MTIEDENACSSLSGRVHYKRLALRGLKAFLQDYPMSKATLHYYGGERRMLQDGVEIVPLEDTRIELPSLLGNK